MTAVIVILVLVAVGVAIGVWWTRSRQSAPAPLAGPVDPLAEGPGGPLDGLGVGAVVGYQGRDYVVRGQIRFDEDGYVWTEYHLDTGSSADGEEGRLWLSVDVNDGTDVALWRPAEDAAELEPSGPVTFEGRTYEKVESGKARFTAAGTTGVPDAGQAWYVDYKAEGGRLLGFERWSAEGSWEVSLGETVPVHLLEIYPAGAASAG